MNQQQSRHIVPIRAALIASVSIVPIWILFSFYEKGLFYFSSIVGLTIGLYILTIGIFMAFVATLLIGVPLRAFMHKRGLSTPWYYAVVGALTPPLVMLLFGGYEQTDKFGVAINYIGFSFTGLIVAMAFWRLTEHVPNK